MLAARSAVAIFLRSPNAGWSSPVARRAHNPKVGGSNPPPATSPPETRRRSTPRGHKPRGVSLSRAHVGWPRAVRCGDGGAVGRQSAAKGAVGGLTAGEPKQAENGSPLSERAFGFTTQGPKRGVDQDSLRTRLARRSVPVWSASTRQRRSPQAYSASPPARGAGAQRVGNQPSKLAQGPLAGCVQEVVRLRDHRVGCRPRHRPNRGRRSVAGRRASRAG